MIFPAGNSFDLTQPTFSNDSERLVYDALREDIKNTFAIVFNIFKKAKWTLDDIDALTTLSRPVTSTSQSGHIVEVDEDGEVTITINMIFGKIDGKRDEKVQFHRIYVLDIKDSKKFLEAYLLRQTAEKLVDKYFDLRNLF